MAYLASPGYAVAYCNYCGSTGCCERALQSLRGGAGGGAGVRDVMDCSAIARRCINDGICDPERVCVVGGSHGGFLGGHLVGQSAVLEAFGVDSRRGAAQPADGRRRWRRRARISPTGTSWRRWASSRTRTTPSSETLARTCARREPRIAHVANAEKKRPVMMLIGRQGIGRVLPLNGLAARQGAAGHGRAATQGVPRGRARARQATDGVRVLRVHRDVFKETLG